MSPRTGRAFPQSGRLRVRNHRRGNAGIQLHRMGSRNHSQRWDCDVPGSYWPPSLPRDNRIETLMRLFAREGFALCDDGSLEPGYEKIALYAFVGHFTHVARQLEDGRWSSKLGNLELVVHPSPASLARGYLRQRPLHNAPPVLIPIPRCSIALLVTISKLPSPLRERVRVRVKRWCKEAVEKAINRFEIVS